MKREKHNKSSFRINSNQAHQQKQNYNINKTILWQTIFVNTAERKVPVFRALRQLLVLVTHLETEKENTNFMKEAKNRNTVANTAGLRHRVFQV